MPLVAAEKQPLIQVIPTLFFSPIPERWNLSSTSFISSASSNKHSHFPECFNPIYPQSLNDFTHCNSTSRNATFRKSPENLLSFAQVRKAIGTSLAAPS